MRIGIDATGLGHTNEWSGIEMYTISLLNALFDINNGDELFIYCANKVPDNIFRTSEDITYRVVKIRNRKFWQQFFMPLKTYSDKIDVMFFPSNSATLFLPCKAVATIHDVHPFVYPEPFSKLHGKAFHKNAIKAVINKHYYRFMLWVASKKDHVIAISKATKQDTVNVFKTSAEKIDVVYNGVNKDKFMLQTAEIDEQQFRNKYNLQDPYVLCVGTHAYKNVAGSIKAFEIIRKNSQAPVKLVIAGSKRPLGDEIYELVEDRSMKQDIIFTGFFPDNDLPGLYSLAEIFLFPSFYEGFGLPVLEAFAGKVPVVTSNTGSLPEVAGDAALLVDPHDIEGIATAVLSVLNDNKMQKQMIAKGLEQVDKFTWMKSATETLGVIRKSKERKMK